jgi:hypothetical protein
VTEDCFAECTFTRSLKVRGSEVKDAKISMISRRVFVSIALTSCPSFPVALRKSNFSQSSRRRLDFIVSHSPALVQAQSSTFFALLSGYTP